MYEDIFINKEQLEKLNNYKLLVVTTELFTQFATFLRDERNYKELNLEIGYFKYDDWTAKLYCIIDEENNIKFKHVRDFDQGSWSNDTLTEQLIYAWEFEDIKFNLNFDIINNFWKVLNEEDREIYSLIYDDVHERFW